MVKASQFIHQPGRGVQKATDVSATDRRYQTHEKKNNDTCPHLLLRLFSGLKFLHNTVFYIMLKNASQDVQ